MRLTPQCRSFFFYMVFIKVNCTKLSLGLYMNVTMDLELTVGESSLDVVQSFTSRQVGIACPELQVQLSQPAICTPLPSPVNQALPPQ